MCRSKCACFGANTHAEQAVRVSGTSLGASAGKCSPSVSSLRMLRRPIPRIMMWCTAPAEASAHSAEERPPILVGASPIGPVLFWRVPTELLASVPARIA